MAKSARVVKWPGTDLAYFIVLPETTADSPLSKQNELIIALDDEIKRLKKE